MNVQREFSDGQIVPGTRYRVIGLIGSGGMGSVYEVEHEELGKRFVLKALLRSLASRDDLQLRLRTEWRALGRLEHPSIVNVTDAGMSSTGVPYYVMERLKGETLAARIRRERRIPLPEALRLVAQLCEGLGAAHHIGIVHRDVKPPNVFLVPGRPATLLDFGIAKILDSRGSAITGRGVAVGTPRYMAPEQAKGEAVDERTDLYALGLVLFECVAGVGPFDSTRDPNELFVAQLTRQPPLLSSSCPGIPPELDQLLSRLLGKSPDERPASAAEVAAELERIEAGLQGHARERQSFPAGPPSPLPLGEQPTRTGAERGAHENTVRADPPTVTSGASATDLQPDTLLDAGPAVTAHGSSEGDGVAPVKQTTERGGSTLRLDEVAAFPVHDPEAPTRTAAPLAPQETPPPVENPGTPAGRAPEQPNWGHFAVAACILAALSGVASVVRAPPPPAAKPTASAPSPAPASTSAQAAQLAPSASAFLPAAAPGLGLASAQPAGSPSAPAAQAPPRTSRQVRPPPPRPPSRALPASGL